MSNYNLPLLRKERDWVAEQRALPFAESQLLMEHWHLENPFKLHDEGKECGTTYCIAGHIAQGTPGVHWAKDPNQVVVGGKVRLIETWAAEQLGLSDDEADHLFYSTDDDVLDVLDELISDAEYIEKAQNGG